MIGVPYRRNCEILRREMLCWYLLYCYWLVSLVGWARLQVN